MPHFILRCLLSCLTAAVLLVQGCATPRDLSLIERASGGMQIDLPATSRLSTAEVCHALRYHVLDFNKHGQLEFPQTNFDCFKDTSDYRNQCENRGSVPVKACVYGIPPCCTNSRSAMANFIAETCKGTCSPTAARTPDQATDRSR